MVFNSFIKWWPQQMIFRRSIRTALIVFISVSVSYMFSFSEKFWITSATILVLQTAVGLTARQGLQRFLIITLSVLLASYAVMIVKNNYFIEGSAVIFISIICYFLLPVAILRLQLAIPLMMGIVVLIAMIMPPLQAPIVHYRTLDVMVGGAIGLIGSLFILPVRADDEFRKEVVPLLEICSAYFQAMIDSLYNHQEKQNLYQKKFQLEMIWQEFPDWVYETGYVAALQEGHRHFLVRIEQIRQILFVLNYLVDLDYDKELLNQIKQPLDDYVLHVQKMIRSITTVLTLEKLSEGAEDLADSFNRLENTFKQLVPYSLEALDINPESISLANFIYELQELGKMVTVLARTLR